MGTAALALENQPGVRSRALDLRGQSGGGGQAQSPVCAVGVRGLILRSNKKSPGIAVFKLFLLIL